VDRKIVILAKIDDF